MSLSSISALRLERLLKLDELLRSPTRCTQDYLAQSLERSERTIRDDLHFLRDTWRAPLENNKAQGWHYTDADWRLPVISLAQGELFALTLGARMLESYAGSVYEVPLRSAIEQLAKRLPGKMAVSLQQLSAERVHFRSGAKVTLDPKIWMQLMTACAEQQQVWLRYYSPKTNQTSERTVDLYVLDVYRASNPYLWGYCHLRKAIRNFRVDRIQTLKVLETRFEPNPSFDLKQVLKDSFQYEVGGEPQAVTIRFDAQTAPYITERQWHSTQEIETHGDGSITLRMTVTGLGDVKRWVFGYGKGAIVLAPPELVRMVQGETEAMARQNETGEFE
ncbi:MAG: WYL domain-containing protein [Cyanobacteria bacterium P01_G01_bin.54]